MTTIGHVTAEQAVGIVDGLVALLQDAVESGASVGFLPPLLDDLARAYWQHAVNDITSGARRLIVAWQDGRLVGTVQLALATQPNGRHRAEVQKLMVHTNMRRRGIGQGLMTAAEDAARAEGRTLLVLDTRRGDPSETLYLKRGYVRAGIIPRYAQSAGGSLEDTGIFYRWL
jgi:GNAT superfamily N-acetyltransferase